MILTIGFLGVLTYIAQAQPIKLEVNEPEVYKDWIVGCDNIGRCEATSLPSDDGDVIGNVTVSRDACPVAQPAVRLFNMELKDGILSVLVDGKEVEIAAVTDGNVRIEGPQAFAVALAIAQGNKMEVRQGDKVIGRLSLAGSAAALRYIDSKQKREGTVTAIVATGPLGAQSVRPALSLPVLRQTPLYPGKETIPDLSADERARAINLSGKCVDDVELYALSETQTLVLMICHVSPYNFNSTALIATGMPGSRNFTSARFDFEPPVALYSASWDTTTGILHSTYLARKMADCGSSEQYVWDGAMFRLAKASSMSECRGLEWITTWRTRVESK